MNNKEIDKIQEYPLDNFDINKILIKDPAQITKYSNLKNVTDINEIFNSNNQAIIFYDLGPIGHWVGLIRKPDENSIEYMDPYGQKPSSPLNWVNENQRITMGINEDFLNPLLEKAKLKGTKIIVSKHKFQSMQNKDNNTCGRHVVSRMLLSELSLPEYNKVIKDSKMNADKFVTLFTHKILGK
jgi:hypothetical protein